MIQSPAPTGSRIEKTSCAKENPKQMEQKVDFFPNSSQTEITEFTVSASLKLAEMFIANFSLRHEIELICVAIELLFLSIQKWGNGAENKPQEIESVKEDVTVQLLEKLGNKLREEFHQQMQEREPLFRELQVRFKLNSNLSFTGDFFNFDPVQETTIVEQYSANGGNKR